MTNVTIAADYTRGPMTSTRAQPEPGRRSAGSRRGRRPGPNSRPARSQPDGPSLRPRIPLTEAKPAMLGYLTAIFLGPVVPLLLYIIARRSSPCRRFHAATALTLSLTGLLYAVCCLIVCGLLLLDSFTVGLAV